MAPHEAVKLQLSRLEYVWELDDFYRLRRLAKMEALPVDGCKVRSQNFGSHTTGHWFLEVSPGKGDREESGEECQIFLCLDVTKTAEAMAELCFTLLDERGKTMEGFKKGSKDFQLFKADGEPGSYHGCTIDGPDIENYIKGGKLTVKCEMVVFLGMEYPLYSTPYETLIEQDGYGHNTYSSNPSEKGYATGRAYSSRHQSPQLLHTHPGTVSTKISPMKMYTTTSPTHTQYIPPTTHTQLLTSTLNTTSGHTGRIYTPTNQTLSQTLPVMGGRSPAASQHHQVVFAPRGAQQLIFMPRN